MKSVLEATELKKGQGYRVDAYEDIHLDYPFHYHAKEYELALHVGCQGTKVVGDHMSNFGQLDLVLMAPGLPHCWIGHAAKGDYRQEDARIIVVKFNSEFFGHHLELPDFHMVGQLLRRAERGVHFSGRTRKAVSEEIQKLQSGHGMDQYLRLLNVLHQLSLSSDCELLCSPVYSFKGTEWENDEFETVHQYILDNYKKKLRIREVARLLNMSDSAFSHYFKKRTFKSFSQFVNELRVGYASRLILETEKNISEAAFESGFNNLSNFNRIFKKVKGCNPRELRKRTSFHG